MSQQILASVEKSSLKPAEEIADFAVGDTVDIHTKIMEGEKDRRQAQWPRPSRQAVLHA
jgi:large subunit ribosomal protein L19